MAADYEAGPLLSSIAAPQASNFAVQHKSGDAFSTGSRKMQPDWLQSLEPILHLSHLHIILVHCTRVSNSNRMPVSGIVLSTPSLKIGVPHAFHSPPDRPRRRRSARCRRAGS
jgi:hypothetical protein